MKAQRSISEDQISPTIGTCVHKDLDILVRSRSDFFQLQITILVMLHDINKCFESYVY